MEGSGHGFDQEPAECWALHAVFERWDGSGFPDGLAGPQIPVPARFTQLSYDALLLHEHLGSLGRIA